MFEGKTSFARVANCNSCLDSNSNPLSAEATLRRGCIWARRQVGESLRSEEQGNLEISRDGRLVGHGAVRCFRTLNRQCKLV